MCAVYSVRMIYNPMKIHTHIHTNMRILFCSYRGPSTQPDINLEKKKCLLKLAENFTERGAT